MKGNRYNNIMQKKLPTFEFEKIYWQKGYAVIGVDEVGRGALAGPVHVGAVCFNGKDEDRGTFHEQVIKLGIDDSKKLSSMERERLSPLIKRHSYTYATSYLDAKSTNRLGIVKATEVAMRRAIEKVRMGLVPRRCFLLIDAFYLKYVKAIGLSNQLAIIKGDQKSISIAAASIIAKVERDQIMSKLHHQYPIYNWKGNKGYGTNQHIVALKKIGKSPLHRDLFLRKIFT